MREKSANDSRLLAEWMRAADDLGIGVDGPFDLLLPSGVHIQAPVLVHGFGGQEGMLILCDYELVRTRIDEIVQAGYGFSILDEPAIDEEYSREVFIEVLGDWGWYGHASDEPAWLKARGSSAANPTILQR